ncbi:dienelactone hydrolase family protein [Streptomyces carpinensis]|uniref:Dienelactone hydrolase family protein n=1 Tax=Streptomyces carpinensis TaxID=66369 RepID=A0ABV1VYU4_9ACTN|nr:dienelactone hydrolase family protein [Streptomyces carpinensis]
MVEQIEITTPDGTAEAYVARPDGDVRGGVLFWMDAIGLRPRIADMVEEIAGWGYAVLAPNAFYRDGRAADLAPKGDLREPEAREAFFASGITERLNNLTPERVAADVPCYGKALDAYAPGLKFGTTGYCMGARLAIRTAALIPDRVVAVGGFHGGGLVTDEPTSPHTAIVPGAEYVFGHADNDASMTPEHVAVLGKALDAAGATYTNEIYPDAPHGYSMSDTSMWHEPSFLRQRAELKALLERRLIR